MATTTIPLLPTLSGETNRPLDTPVGVGLTALVPAIAAAATWICCLPIAIGAVGVGTAAFGTALAPLRPLPQWARARAHRCGPLPGASPRWDPVRTRGILRRSVTARPPEALVMGMATVTIALLTVDRWSSYVILWFL